MAAPPDPRDRLPPYLASYCPDPAVVRQRTRLWVGKGVFLLYDWLTRFGSACARNWRVLDGTGRLFVACLGVVSLCCALLAVAGWSRKPGDDVRSVGHNSRNDYPKQQSQPNQSGNPTPPAPSGMDSNLIQLRLQALYAALAALPASVPLADAPARDQQEYNLRYEISQLEAALAKAKQAPAKSGQQK